jgi:hypothetical protein
LNFEFSILNCPPPTSYVKRRKGVEEKGRKGEGRVPFSPLPLFLLREGGWELRIEN